MLCCHRAGHMILRDNIRLIFTVIGPCKIIRKKRRKEDWTPIFTTRILKSFHTSADDSSITRRILEIGMERLLYFTYCAARGMPRGVSIFPYPRILWNRRCHVPQHPSTGIRAESNRMFAQHVPSPSRISQKAYVYCELRQESRLVRDWQRFTFTWGCRFAYIHVFFLLMPPTSSFVLPRELSAVTDLNYNVLLQTHLWFTVSSRSIRGRRSFAQRCVFSGTRTRRKRS